MSEERLKLILEWLEANPRTYETVREKIDNLGVATKVAARAVMAGAKTDQEKEVALKAVRDTNVDYTDSIMRGVPGYKMAADAHKKIDQQMEEQKKRTAEGVKSWKHFGGQVSSAGMRIGWLGYRMTMMGRIMTNYLMKPINQILNLLKDWDKTMGDVAYTIGVLTYTGLGSTEMLNTLRETLTKLPEAGMMMQAATGAITGVLATIGVDLAPVVSKALVELADAFLQVWEKTSPTLIPLLQELVDSVLPPLIDLIKEVGPAVIEGFVNGITIAIPLIIGMLSALRPFLPAIASLIGFLIPFAPILMAVGMGMYFLSPAMMAIGTLISWVAPLFGGLGAMLGTLLPIVGAIAAAILVGVTVFEGLKGSIGPLPAAIIAIAVAIGTAIGVFYLLQAAVGMLAGVFAVAGPTVGTAGTGMAAGLTALTPAIPVILTLAVAALAVGAAFYLAGAGVAMAVGAIIDLAKNLNIVAPLVPVLFAVATGMLAIAAAGLAMIPAAVGAVAMSVGLIALAAGVVILATAFMTLAVAAAAFNAVGGVVQGVVGGLTGVLGGLGDALRGLCFKHATPMAEAFNETLGTTRDQTVAASTSVEGLASSLRSVRPTEAGVGGGGGIGGGGGPQYITVSAPISIGSVTGNVDLPAIQDYVTRGIANALNKRSR